MEAGAAMTDWRAIFPDMDNPPPIPDYARAYAQALLDSVEQVIFYGESPEESARVLLPLIEVAARRV